MVSTAARKRRQPDHAPAMSGLRLSASWGTSWCIRRAVDGAIAGAGLAIPGVHEGGSLAGKESASTSSTQFVRSGRPSFVCLVRGSVALMAPLQIAADARGVVGSAHRSRTIARDPRIVGLIAREPAVDSQLLRQRANGFDCVRVPRDDDTPIGRHDADLVHVGPRRALRGQDIACHRTRSPVRAW